MKTHTSQFKENIAKFGRELDSKITYSISGTTTELGSEQLNSVSPHYEGAILKSVMKQLDIDSNIKIPIGTILTYQFGVKVGNSYEYLNYGNYVVYSVKKQRDTRSYKITCYDKMLYAMKEYENSNITFPITIRDYIGAICTKIGLTFANASDQFANYNKTLNNEVYLDSDGRTLNYTFRDVLDELAQVTASTICINNNDELEIRYINQTVGKNLLNVTATTTTTNGVTFTVNKDKSITLSGTNTGSTSWFRLAPNFTLPEGTYTLSNGASVSYNVALFMDDNHNFGYGLSTKTFDENVTVSPYIRVNANAVVDNLTIYPMIVEGSYTSETIPQYEPYGDTIDEEYLKDVNVNFGEKYGPVNTIVLSRGGDGDKISLSQPTNLADADKIAIQISDNQIMNGNDRNTYMADILTKLYGLEYYINDFTSPGICYLNLCDKYNIKVDSKFYSCIMFNNSAEITQGLQENIYTEAPEEEKQEYKYIGSTDRGITQANIIAQKAEATITEYTQRIDENTNRLNAVETKQTDTDRTISVISTNIDSEGNITEVTTTTGFTFNAEGMTISDNTTNFSALHRNDGTYYKDGDTIVGQYTKDGSKQKDLQLFGVYYYGMHDKDDTPMFVAQLYNDEDGEECFGHFYNRGD